ncbi:MAG: hypothetical protein ABI380_13645, partial [Edaphobacter sp.]
YSVAPVGVDRTMNDLAQNQWHVPYVSFFDTFCKPGCPIYAAPHVPINMDEAHLTSEGGALFAQAIKARIQSLDTGPSAANLQR